MGVGCKLFRAVTQLLLLLNSQKCPPPPRQQLRPRIAATSLHSAILLRVTCGSVARVHSVHSTSYIRQVSVTTPHLRRPTLRGKRHFFYFTHAVQGVPVFPEYSCFTALLTNA